MIRSTLKFLLALALVAVAWPVPRMAVAQDAARQAPQPQASASLPQFHRTVVLKSDLHGLPGKQMQAWVAELAPGATIAKHAHPYDEFVYVVDGCVVVQIEGQPAHTLHVGEVGHVPPRTAHESSNCSSIYPVKALVFGLTTEGEPLTVPLK